MFQLAFSLFKRATEVRIERVESSDAFLKSMWLEIRAEWFPDREDVDRYNVIWSSRPQKRTLASCGVERKRVIVARELDRPEYHKYLPALLYHEMCHAILGPEQSRNGSRRRSWHGRSFKALERLHPEIALLDSWIKQGGWAHAVRSDRARRSHEKRKRVLKRLSGSSR